MRKITLFFLTFIFLINSSVHALSWAYSFVVWKGKVYEVKQEVIIEVSEIGKIIGEVKTKPNDMTGDYYGDASNTYPKGTKYYEIKDISTSTAIAVKEDDNQWVKAVYVHKAPFHIMNLLSNSYFISFIVISVVIVIGVKFRFKKAKNK